MATIILLNGPPAAGKTTVSKMFIKAQEPTEWAYLSHDDLRQLVQSGYKTADKSRHEWDQKTKKQWHVAAQNCVDLAVNFQLAGISSVIDFYATKRDFSYWNELLTGVDFMHYILFPKEAVDLARNAARPSPAHLTTQKIRESYEAFTDWAGSNGAHIIDNSEQTPEQTVASLTNLL